MTSTTSFREALREWKALYGWNLRRSRGMALLYFGLILLAGPVLLFLAGSVSSTGLSISAVRSMATVSGALSLPITMIFTLVFAIQRLGYMHNKRSVDLYHAMPVRRIPMLLAAWSASATVLLLSLLADVVMMILSAVILGCYDIDVLTVEYFRIFGSQMFFAVVCLTFCMLMAVCSGTTMDMVISIVLTNFFYPLVILMVMVLGSWLLPGFNGNYSPTLFTALAPFPAMVVGLIFAGDYMSPLLGYDYTGEIPAVFWGWWVLLLLVMLGVSLWLYTRRKSESAESDLAFPVPKLLLRFLCSAGVGLLAGMVFYLVSTSTVSFFFGFLFFSIMAHAVTEALYSRGLKRFVRTLPAYLAMVLCVVVLYCTAATGFFGYATYLPETIQSASVQSGYSANFGNTWAVDRSPIALRSDSNLSVSPVAVRDQVTYKDPSNMMIVTEIQKMLVSSRKPENSAFYPFLPSGTVTRFTYQTPSGTESREIKADPYLSNEELERLWELLYESDEWKEQTFPYVLDPKGISQIWIRYNKPSTNGDGTEYEEIDFPATPTEEERRTLLELLQEDVKRGDVFYQYQDDDTKNLYVQLDIGREFVLTKDSPWYDLAPEQEGQWVQQYWEFGTPQIVVSPDMTETYDFLQTLIKKYSGTAAG